MNRKAQLFLNVSIVCCLLTVGGIGFVAWTIRPASDTGGREALTELRHFSEGSQVLKESLHLAERLAALSQSSPAGLDTLRERARLQKDLSSEFRSEMKGWVYTLDSISELPGLLEQSDDLLDLAVGAAPRGPVPASQAATAPALSEDPNVTGVLPGTAKLVTARAIQLRENLDLLAQKADRQAAGRGLGLGQFLGMSSLGWLLSLCIPCASAPVAILLARFLAQVTPEKMLEHKIKRIGASDPQKAVGFCHEQIGRMMDLAQTLMRRVGA